MLIEAKCATLVVDGIAKFPDAPTERGQRHIRELIKAKNEGFNTGIFFIIQRNDAEIFMPNYEMDPKFSKVLVEAYREGVLIKAIICNVTINSISLEKEVKVRLT